MRVLVVEDEVKLARQIASALTEAGHDPIIVHDGERGLRKATETSFDLGRSEMKRLKHEIYPKSRKSGNGADGAGPWGIGWIFETARKPIWNTP